MRSRLRRAQEYAEQMRQSRNAMAEESSAAHMAVSMLRSQLSIVVVELERAQDIVVEYDRAQARARQRQVQP